MNKKKRDIIMLIGSFFVAIIFITGYAANGSNSIPNANTTTIAQRNNNTIFAIGNANAIVTGYGNTFYINLTKSNDSNITANALNGYEAKGLIDTYNQLNQTYFDVFASGNQTYDIYRNLSTAIGYNAFTLYALEHLHYTNYVNMSANGHKVPLVLNKPYYSVETTNITKINSSVHTVIDAIIEYTNGSYRVYQNNVSIKVT